MECLTDLAHASFGAIQYKVKPLFYSSNNFAGRINVRVNCRIVKSGEPSRTRLMQPTNVIKLKGRHFLRLISNLKASVAAVLKSSFSVKTDLNKWRW